MNSLILVAALTISSPAPEYDMEPTVAVSYDLSPICTSGNCAAGPVRQGVVRAGQGIRNFGHRVRDKIRNRPRIFHRR